MKKWIVFPLGLLIFENGIAIDPNFGNLTIFNNNHNNAKDSVFCGIGAISHQAKPITFTIKNVNPRQTVTRNVVVAINGFQSKVFSCNLFTTNNEGVDTLLGNFMYQIGGTTNRPQLILLSIHSLHSYVTFLPTFNQTLNRIEYNTAIPRT